RVRQLADEQGQDRAGAGKARPKPEGGAVQQVHREVPAIIAVALRFGLRVGHAVRRQVGPHQPAQQPPCPRLADHDPLSSTKSPSDRRWVRSWKNSQTRAATRPSTPALAVTSRIVQPSESCATPAHVMLNDCARVSAAHSKAKTRPRTRSGTIICRIAELKTHRVPEPTVRTSVPTLNQASVGATANIKIPAISAQKLPTIAQRIRSVASPSQRRSNSGPNP